MRACVRACVRVCVLVVGSTAVVEYKASLANRAEMLSAQKMTTMKMSTVTTSFKGRTRMMIKRRSSSRLHAMTPMKQQQHQQQQQNEVNVNSYVMINELETEDFEVPFPIGNAEDLQNKRVLVLDVAMRTTNIVSWQKALILAMFDKVDVLEYYEMMVASAYRAFYVPAVVKTRVYDKNSGAISLSRKNLLIRDKYTCNYCGKNEGNDLTIDHIIPVSKGGEWSWTNLTTACAKCNNRKGDKYLKDCQPMKLRREPKEPCVQSGEFSPFSRIVNPPELWLPYLDSRNVRIIPDSMPRDLEFGDVSIKNNVVAKRQPNKSKNKDKHWAETIEKIGTGYDGFAKTK